MTLKEAILKSLEDIKAPATHKMILQNILVKKYDCLRKGLTPDASISAALGDFIRKGDARVKRIKQGTGGGYLYYLTKDEQDLDLDTVTEELDNETAQKTSSLKGYDEGALHMLLSSYLYTLKFFSKTIRHTISQNGRDSNQIWTHPDMVGIRFQNFKNSASRNFSNLVNRSETFVLSSYEIKKEINNDSDLKKAYFQAVSNSSWANYGYLVAYEISDSLNEEMERLNQSFGIGIIELNNNPFQSKILFQPRYRDLDFITIDKLCNINPDFQDFITATTLFMGAEEKFQKLSKESLEKICDPYLENDFKAEQYCLEYNIPNKNTENLLQT